MPVSLDQIVAAFFIMWCMTLKCRTAVPGDSSRTVVRFSYQRATASPSTSRTNDRPNSYQKGARIKQQSNQHNMKSVWNESWYVDPIDGQKRRAWQSAAEFVGE